MQAAYTHAYGVMYRVQTTDCGWFAHMSIKNKESNTEFASFPNFTVKLAVSSPIKIIDNDIRYKREQTQVKRTK